jgi:hypothetical protein
MTHSDSGDPLRDYGRKYRVPEGMPVNFNAGFAMLTGPAGLTFADGQPLVLAAGTGLWFRGQAPGHPLFQTVEGHREGEWNPVVTYQLLEGRKPKTIPLWIVPSLVPSSDQRALEIDLHWTPLGDDDGPRVDLFDLIQLRVPAAWGNMENVEPSEATTTPPTRGQEHRIIEWQQLAPRDEDVFVQLRERRSRSLRIRFEKPITASSTLSGRIEATFKGTLSGVTGVQLYLPGGRKPRREQTGHQDGPSAKTKVAVDFTIDLSAIRYQDDRVVPDENNAADIRAHRDKISEFAGVIPNSAVITRLTDEISKDDYYVKSVVEHEPDRDYGQANALHRVWDIAGRFYTGVFPIDFDIHVRGREIQGASGASAGNTAVQVTVKGSYTTGGNSDGSLLAVIEGKWEELHAKVTGIFRDPSLAQPGGGWATGASQWSGPAPLNPAPAGAAAAIDRGDAFEPRAIRPAEVVEPASVRPPAVHGGDPDKAERKADLMRQWKIADEAVMTGRIADDVYRAMITRIRAELRDLGEDLGE